MPEKITKDTGMMQRTEISYRMDDPRDVESCIAALKEWTDSFPNPEPGDWDFDALRRRKAENCRQILATVGMTHDGSFVVNTRSLRDRGFGEDSAQWIAAHWLAKYNALMKGREDFDKGDTTPSNISSMLYAAEEMGKLQERMWWRSGVDSPTNKRREELALAGRKQVQGGQNGRAMRSDTSFKAQNGHDAQEYANQLNVDKPALTWAAICQIVATRYSVSAGTIKKSLKNPKKHG